MVFCSNGIPPSCLFSNPMLHVRFPAKSNGPGPHLTGRRSTIGWDGRLLCPHEDAPSAIWLCLGAHKSTFHPHLAMDRVPGQCQGSMGIGYCTFGANLARLKNRPRFPRKRMVKRVAFVFAQPAVADQNPLVRQLHGSRGLGNAPRMGQIGSLK